MMKPTMPTYDNPASVLTGEQMNLVYLDIQRGMAPHEAILKHVAVPNYSLPGHRPVYWYGVLVGYGPVDA